jgi:murein DD-endopeptidase MepM/ murein hydrolase activator NlpD
VWQYHLPQVSAVILMVFVIIGIGGFFRLSHFALSLVYARFGVMQEKSQNQTLKKQLEFLNRLTLQVTKRVDDLAEYENVARFKYGLNSISDDVRKAGIGGAPDVESIVIASLRAPEVSAADIVNENIAALLRKVQLQNLTFNRLVDHAKRQRNRWSQRPSIWPVSGRITSSYGRRIHPFTGTSIFHEGLDIANSQWTPVRATADGMVDEVVHKLYYGNMVILQHHATGYTTRYAHLVSANVEPGKFVSRGEVIGYMGNTGRSTGPHLHYEVRRQGRPLDPLEYILPTSIVID